MKVEMLHDEEVPDADYRKPLSVRRIIYFSDETSFPVCPRCSSLLYRRGTNFCECCGQRLEWKAQTGQMIYFTIA